MKQFPVIPLIAFVGFFAIVLLHHHQRNRAIRELAKRLHFTYLGAALPKSLSFRSSTLAPVTGVWNVIDGDRLGIRVVAFDCRVGYGKASWRRTVIAAQSTGEVFGVAKFNKDLTVEKCGDWTLLYRPRGLRFIIRGLMELSELEANLSAIPS